jgi:signal peptide peptidase SppA
MMHEKSLNDYLSQFADRTIASAGAGAAAGLLEIAASSNQMVGNPEQNVKSGIAVIKIRGPISHHVEDDFLSFFFGGVTVDEISDAFSVALENPNVRGVVFDIDSPGGSTAGIFDLSDEIYKARGTKPIFSLINEGAYSAAYVIGSASDRIYIPRTGGAGSLGIIAIHLDESAADEKEGFKYTVIKAGDRKADGFNHAPLSAEAYEQYQQEVNRQYNLLIDTVARNRNMKASALRSQQAGLFYGKEAISNGLADAVLSYKQAFQSVVKQVSGKKAGSSKIVIGGQKMDTVIGKIKGLIAEHPDFTEASVIAAMGYTGNSDFTQVSAALKEAVDAKAEADAKIVELQKKLGDDITAAKKEVEAYATEVVEICALAGFPDMAAPAIKGKKTVDALKKEILEAKAKGNTLFNSTLHPLNNGTESLVVELARKAAADAAVKK